MSRLEEAERAIGGVGRLAIFDRHGVDSFGRDRTAAVRSFFAYVLVLPATALLIALDVTYGKTGTPTLLAASDVIAWIIEIAGFPLLLIPLFRFYRRSERWSWAIAALNWFKAARLVLYLGVYGLCIGPLEGLLGAWPLLLFTVYAWIVEAFLADAVLDIGGPRAAIIVLVDALFGLVIDAVGNWIGTGSFF